MRFFLISTTFCAVGIGTFLISTLISRCIITNWRYSELEIKVIAVPVFPARPVRPIRCTYDSESCGSE